jgi:membrane protease YdiL (CAAX protease family)
MPSQGHLGEPVGKRDRELTGTRARRTPRGGWGPLVAYGVLAYAFSWSWWWTMAARGEVSRPGVGWPSHLPGLLGPALAAVVVTAVTQGRAGLADLWSRMTRWRLPLWCWGVLLVTLGLLTAPLVHDRVTGRTPHARDFLVYSGVPVWPALALVLYVVVVNGFGEEIGWREFLAERLLTATSTRMTALLVWAVWAGWHIPMFWVVESFRSFGPGGVVGWAVGLGFGSVVLTNLYVAGRHSILLVALWHTAFNLTTATAAANGLVAAVSSTAVCVAGVVLLLRPRQPDRKSPA